MVLAGSSGSGAGMLVARVESVCIQQGQSKQLAHLNRERPAWKFDSSLYLNTRDYTCCSRLLIFCFITQKLPLTSFKKPNSFQRCYYERKDLTESVNKKQSNPFHSTSITLCERAQNMLQAKFQIWSQ